MSIFDMGKNFDKDNPFKDIHIHKGNINIDDIHIGTFYELGIDMAKEYYEEPIGIVCWYCKAQCQDTLAKRYKKAIPTTYTIISTAKGVSSTSFCVSSSPSLLKPSCSSQS